MSHARDVLTLCCALTVLGTFACSGPSSSSSSDAGSGSGADAGPSGPPKPLPFPLVRMNDDAAGTSHAVNFQGAVKEIGDLQPADNPFTDGSQPARYVSVTGTDGSTDTLYYTLPTGFYLAVHPQDQVQVLYREKAGGFASSYGARVENLTGKLVAMFEDGELGSALDDSERLGFTFTRDPERVSSEPDACGTKVHYPVVVQNGDHKKRLFGGQSEPFTLPDGESVTFTLFDAWRIEDASCSDVPELAIGYDVRPAN